MRANHCPRGSRAHWRSVAGEAQVAKREKTEPHHNNYDGRNYITSKLLRYPLVEPVERAVEWPAV